MTTITFETFIYRYDEATDTEEEFDVTVTADVYPAERRTWHHPGCDAYAEAHTVLRDGQDISDQLTEEEGRELDEKALQEAAERAEAAQAEAIDHAIDMWKEDRILSRIST